MDKSQEFQHGAEGQVQKLGFRELLIAVEVTEYFHMCMLKHFSIYLVKILLYCLCNLIFKMTR